MNLRYLIFIINSILTFSNAIGQSDNQLPDIIFPSQRVNDLDRIYLRLATQKDGDRIKYSIDGMLIDNDSLEASLTSIVKKNPDSLKNRIVLDLAIDKDVSLEIYNNIEKIAKRSGIYKINYINKEGEKFIDRLRPSIDENEPIGEYNYPCMVHKGKFVNVIGEYTPFKRLNHESYDDFKECLDSCSNCQYYKPLGYIELQNNELSFNEKLISDTVLFDSLLMFVDREGLQIEKINNESLRYKNLIIILKADYHSTFEKYLNAYIQINKFYSTIWEKESQRLYSQNYNDLDFVSMKKVRTNIPYAAGIVILSEAYWD